MGVEGGEVVALRVVAEEGGWQLQWFASVVEVELAVAAAAAAAAEVSVVVE